MPATNSPRGGRVDLITETARDALNVRRVVGDPIVHGDTMIIPVARVGGGSGMGFGAGSLDARARVTDSAEGTGEGDGGGGGFGVSARALGVYVVRGDDVVWRPAVDVTRVVLAGQAVAAITVLALARVIRRRSGRR
jgi:uncharacterized spore protein YtfJ